MAFSHVFIVALWGVESNFGRLMGNYNVIEALSTLAYEGRREAFFRKQVMAALQILDEGHITAEKYERFMGGGDGATSIYANLVFDLCC